MTEKIVGAQYVVVKQEQGHIFPVGTLVELEYVCAGVNEYIGVFSDSEGRRGYLFMSKVRLIAADSNKQYIKKALDTSQAVAQSLNTLVQQYGMATVTSGIEQWVKFHIEEQ